MKRDKGEEMCKRYTSLYSNEDEQAMQSSTKTEYLHILKSERSDYIYASQTIIMTFAVVCGTALLIFLIQQFMSLLIRFEYQEANTSCFCRNIRIL